MPSFEIPDGPTTVALKGGGQAPQTGAIQFSVTNRSGGPRSGRLSLRVTGDTRAEWFKIEGETERNFLAGETHTASVVISVPPGTAPGDYPFRPRVVAVNDPDNDFADGPASTLRVDASAPPPPNRTWLWILIAVIVVVIVGGVAFLAFRPDGDEPPPADPPPVADPVATLPELSGRPLAELEALATQHGFQVTVAERVEGLEPGHIVSVFPAANTPITADLRVTAIVDPGIAVPDLRNKRLAAAQNEIRQARLTLSEIRQSCRQSGVDDLVISQEPAGGVRVKLNQPLVITITDVQTSCLVFRPEILRIPSDLVFRRM
ncbi:hypothetical protein GCM10007973_08530 [Polymorphobacter multimanifer]|uniref:PASTA domain-containing protein n=1 Tax=Polymorphobacter multimanifer TaxID=1070431 RepID=A0A841L5B1_9SPHN|nr:PASTA domain-containing protein [Polymorphobacter multimanifer]MBB6228079.1 hypothetical protein [Polymorphobacter multimanifer]GGI74011.1 hypothetical protein GCM10007973_08530 [Polymorphobacter multimanifer]